MLLDTKTLTETFFAGSLTSISGRLLVKSEDFVLKVFCLITNNRIV